MALTLIMVALGGALGAVLRFLVGLAVAFPYGTLAVNVAGSVLIGLVWVALSGRGEGLALPFLMAGVLGGFTTFSTFSLDTLRLVEEGRLAMALAYAGGSVMLALAGTFAAVALARTVWS